MKYYIMILGVLFVVGASLGFFFKYLSRKKSAKDGHKMWFEETGYKWESETKHETIVPSTKDILELIKSLSDPSLLDAEINQLIKAYSLSLNLPERFLFSTSEDCGIGEKDMEAYYKEIEEMRGNKI